MNVIRIGFVFLVALMPLTAEYAHAQQREKIAEELNEVVRALNEQQSWIEKTDKTLSTLTSAGSRADIRINEISTSIVSMTQEIEAIDQEISQLQVNMKRWDTLEYFQSKKLAWHIYAASMLDRRNPVMFIFGEVDRLKADRLVRHHRYLIGTGIPALKEYDEFQEKLKVKAAGLTIKKKQREEAYDKLNRETDRLNDEQQQRKNLTITLRRQLNQTKNSAVVLEVNRNRLTQLLSSLETSSSRRTEIPRDINSHWPVDGTVIHEFNEPRAGGRLKWQGVFIEAELGSMVNAVASGQVRFAGYFKGFGMAMVIDHGDGLLSVYANCNVLLKRNGDLVEAAEVIAQAGQSGGQTNTGIYLEIRLNNNPIDPLDWLTKRDQ